MTGAAYRALVLADTPWGYWRLSDGSGPAASDEVGGGPSAAYAGTFSLGNAGLFSDTTAVNLQSSGYVLPVTGWPSSVSAWSIEFCVRAPLQGATYIWQCGFGGNVVTNMLAYVVFNPGGSVDFGTEAGSTPTDAIGFASYAPPNWHHCCFTYDGSVMRNYIDGFLDLLTAGVAHPNLNASQQASLGGWWSRAAASNTRLNGLAAEYALYNHVLTPAQVKAHFDRLSADSVQPVGQPASSALLNSVSLDVTEILACVKHTYQ